MGLHIYVKILLSVLLLKVGSGSSSNSLFKRYSGIQNSQVLSNYKHFSKALIKWYNSSGILRIVPDTKISASLTGTFMYYYTETFRDGLGSIW